MLKETYFSIVIITTLLGIVISLIYSSLRLGITPTPTSPSVKKALISLLPERVFGEIHELGSGWGTLFKTIRRQYPFNSFFAYERSPVPRIYSLFISRLLKTNVSIYNQDLFEADLSNSGLVLCYLYPGAMKKLSSHLQKKLPKNCWIISHTFQLPGWTPVKEIQATDLYKTSVYLYRT